jgi:hypothetical protein
MSDVKIVIDKDALCSAVDARLRLPLWASSRVLEVPLSRYQATRSA